MSAICGIFRLGEQPLPLDVLGRMMQALEQHGPDGSATWQDEWIGLGHQMMHTTPQSLDEHLPLHHGESQISLTADARLDNREDVLRLLGMAPTTDLPDSSLILKAYQAWGKACVDRLVGEFAFAIWDARDRCLHCFTDPMGVRPLFYTEVPGHYFAFASEVVALLAINKTPAPLNERRLAMLGVSALSVYLEPEATCFENIYRVPAASVLSISSRGKTSTEYWRPDCSKRLQFSSDAECREAFQEVFFKAVGARLRSAFPVASMLSGGLDSSGIVGAASHLLAKENKSLITLSSVPEPMAQGQVTDEREYIDLFKGKANLEMHYVCAPGRGPFDQLDELVKTASLCSYSYQHFLYTAFVRTAKENKARVILDGDGGEFSASSYLQGYLAELLLAGKWQTLVTELRHSSADKRIHLSAIKRQVLRPLVPYPVLRFLNRHSKFKNLVEYPIRAGFVQDVLGQDIGRIRDQIFRFLLEYPNHRKNMVRDLLLEQRDIRQRSHAGFVDYQNARFSYPYLDKRVFEFSLAVDGRYQYQDGSGRRLLRMGMDGLIPNGVLARTSKAPFSPDYHLRYARDKAEAVSTSRGFSGSGKLRGMVDFEKVLQALEQKTIYRSENPMRADHDSQFTVPYGLYLCYFLRRFERRNRLVDVQS